jgi:hypothetical protein
MSGNKMFIIEKKNKKNKARNLDAFDINFDTDFKILERNGKCIIKKMDMDTFMRKFG